MYLIVQLVSNFSGCSRKPCGAHVDNVVLGVRKLLFRQWGRILDKADLPGLSKACRWTCVCHRNGTCTRGLSVRISRTFRSTRHHSFAFTHLRPVTGGLDRSLCRHSAMALQIRPWMVLSTSLSVHNSLIILSTWDSSVIIMTTLRAGVQRIVFRLRSGYTAFCG
jgi:hypothetical protein